MEYEVLGEKIIYFKNVFPELDIILKDLKSKEWSRWDRANGDLIGTQIILHDQHKDERVFIKLKEETEKIWEIYKNYFQIKDNLLFESNLHVIKKWNENIHGMGLHTDSFYRDGDLVTPDYTMCYYLTDKYSGGKLEIPDFNISITPEKGSAIVFPSSYIHKVTDFLNGERIMCNLFAYKIK